MMQRLLALVAVVLLAGCGGGGGSTGNPAAGGVTVVAPPAAPVNNTATVTIDAGPAALQVGTDAYSAFNEPYVTITICAPGSTTVCQTIDHIILDTGSVGVRLLQPALSPALLAALPAEKSAGGNPVGECYQYVNSYAFGSVKLVDFAIAGESVARMPVQIIADTGSFAAVPASCSSGGGSAVLTVKDFAANGIIGVGTTTTDCGAQCAAGGSTGAIYYDCPSSGCGPVIARASAAAAPFEQLPNPVAAFAVDNNGTILTLPTVAPTGVSTLTGSVVFGIGTQSDNALKAGVVLPVTTSASTTGVGVLTATYNGTALTESFLDSGSGDYFFIDTSLPPCTDTAFIAFYCPSAPQTIAAVLMAASGGATANVSFTLYDPHNLDRFASVGPGLGVNPTLVVPPLPFANSFDFGLPFFFGRSVYTAIEGRPAGGVAGPYFAF